MKARRVWILLTTVVVVAALFLFVFPTRTYLAQRESLAGAEERLEVLRRENALLEQRISLLRTDSEIERIAREEYNLVRPGEEAFAVLPPPEPPVDLPGGWPFDQLEPLLNQRG
ncbi:MAG: FtsB family cell division protein [Actinomycetota bacterium]